MSHNLEIRTIGGTKVASYVENTRKAIAWHGLGKHYDRPLSAEEAILGCNADFHVEKYPVMALTPQLQQALLSGEELSLKQLQACIIKDKMATVRTDLNRPLGIVSKEYGLVQNTHAFDFVDMLTTGKMGGETPTIECAGVLGQGERIFITAKFPDSIRMRHNDNDLINMYVVFTTSHDGTGAVTCMITPIRVVCNNTLNMAFCDNRAKMTWRHTANVLENLDLRNHRNQELAFKTLKLYKVYREEFEDNIIFLESKKFNEAQAIHLIAMSLLNGQELDSYMHNGFQLNTPDISQAERNRISKVMDTLHLGVGQDLLTRGTGLWLINGLTTYFQNVRYFKSSETKFNSILAGEARNNLQKMYNHILAS